jgi:uncharacterized membrane-anchored protein
MSDRLDRTLQHAIAAGLLPADARRPAGDGRPWPVVLLIGLGAWLAAVPLLGVVATLLGDLITTGPGPYLVGWLVLAAAVVVLRSQGLPLFVEQLAVPALLVGIGTLGFGLFDDLSHRGAAAGMALTSLGLAAVIPRPWLRVLLGAAGAGLCIFALVPERAWGRGAWSATAWVALHGALAAWATGLLAQYAAVGQRPRVAAALESIGAGWLLATLSGLALVTGMTFLVGAGMDPLARELVQELTAGRAPAVRPSWMQVGSTLLVLVATLWGARGWPELRRPWVLGVGLVAAGLAWFLPNLGGVWLALVLTATTWRWRLAAAAMLAAAWIIGGFYYQLQWPLTIKALVLVGAGALLGALAWLGGRRALASREAEAGAATGEDELDPSGRGRVPDGPGRMVPRLAIALTALATLAVVNVGIWEKENIIAQGQPVFVELAPVDPRSLMQGDYMRLAFHVPGAVGTALGAPSGERRLVVARLDGRGVATLLRPASPGESPADGELLVELTPKGGRWGLASDAWYFKEGDGKRWEAARYGEFRVAADGQVLLVGMADAELRRIAR